MLNGTHYRTNVNHPLFLSIAIDSFLENKKLYEDYSKQQTLQNSQNSLESCKLAHKCYIEYLKTIVFSAMSIEAFLFDFASRYLTDKDVLYKLGKKTPLSKCIIIPKLTHQLKLKKRYDPINSINELFKERY